VDAGRIAAEKCANGAVKKRLEPGKYTVILEPAAVSDLIGYLGFSMSARDAEQGQSFLSKKGDKPGETLLGEKLFPEYITLRSDPFNPKLRASPWGPSLLPNEKIGWIEKGVVKNLMQVTGLTRDGLFLVENGKVTSPLMNFRWNESPVRVLQNTKMLAQPVPTQGTEA
jgi:predicted Zn-dependent protease